MQPDGRLDLCKQDLGVAGCHELTQALQGHPHVHSLMLGTDAIGDQGARAVANLIPTTPNLETVYLGCNAISAEGVAHLAAAVAESPQVQALWMKRNPIGPAGIRRLADMLKDAPHLRTLDLVHTQMDLESLEYLVDALVSSAGIERLYLGGNALDSRVASSLKHLLEKPGRLIGLYLNVNKLGDAGLEVLSEGMLHNTTLREWGLGSNGLSPVAGDILAPVLRSHPGLERLELGRSPSTKVLGASPNDLGDGGVYSLAGALPFATGLRHLELDGNGVTSFGQEVLAEMIRRSRLVSLKIEAPSQALQKVLADNLAQYGSPAMPEELTMIRSVYR